MQAFTILTILILVILASEWLARNTILRNISASLLVILFGAILANTGLIPSASTAIPLYGHIFHYVAPASIFFLLLGVDLKNIRKAGVPMLLAFGLGALGTAIGVIVALQIIDYQLVFGKDYAAISGMMTGTYIGGSANFNALAIEFDMLRKGAEYTGMVVADNIVTTVWMLVTLVIPPVFQKILPHPKNIQHTAEKNTDVAKPVSLMQLLIVLSLAMLTILFSEGISIWFAEQGLNLPSILVLTTVALILAQFRSIRNMAASRMLGLFSIYLFLTVVGAYCEISALVEVGDYAVQILIFTVSIVAIHGIFLLGMSVLLKLDWAVVAIASQANIGGSSTALALAESFKRDDLLLPAILVGSLGTALGTYIGFLVAALV